MNKPRAIRNKDGVITGYKVEVKWRGQRYYFTRRTAAAAETCWAKAIADLEANIHPYDRYKHEKPQVAEAPKAITFGEWLDDWHPKRRLTPKTRYNQTTCIDAHVTPDLGDVPLIDGEMTRSRIQEWVWTLEEEYAPRYVRMIYGIVRLALNDAIDEPSVPLTASPMVRIRFEEMDPTGRRALTPEQVAAVASRCGIHATLVWSLAFTGARIGELLARDVSDWSWRTGITIAGKPVEVDESEPRRRKKGTKKTKASKTAAGARTINLCASHNAMIRDYAGARREGPLFIGRYGKRADYHSVYETVARAAEAARTAKVDIPAGFSPHWLRKTARTWGSEDKAQRIALDYRMGHATPGMEGIYEEPTPAMLDEIAKGLEVRWQQAMAAPGLLRRKTA